MGELPVPSGFGEGAAHRDLASTCVAEGGDGVTLVAQCVSPLVAERSLGGTVALDELPDTVPAPPPVGPLAAGVAAVDGPSAGSEAVDDGALAHGAGVLVDDVVGGQARWERSGGLHDLDPDGRV